MKVSYTAIGRNIRAARNKAGLTQAKMAELLRGMSTEADLTPFPVHSDGIGTIIDFLCAGCSDRARGLMLDVCTLIAQQDKY